MASPSLNQTGRQPYEQQPLFGIDFVPPKVRGHGLREAHTHPLVSPGKRADGTMSLYRVPAIVAWRRRRRFHHIELNTPTSYPLLAFDVDRYHAHEFLVDLWDDDRIPELNWTTERVATTHAQAVLTLLRPVLRGEWARRNPQRVLARISEYLAQTMGADRGYNGLVAFNPVAATRQLKTRWGRPQPYGLAELRAFVPKGWRMPPPPELITEVGRNCWLFEDSTRWRWREENRGLGDLDDLLDYLVGLNEVVFAAHPLGFNEIKGIAKSVQKYWERHSGIHTVAWLDKQSWRAKRRAQLEREKNAPRDYEIQRLNYGGWSEREIGAELEIPRSTVHDVLAGNETFQLPFDVLDGVPAPPSQVQRLELDRIVHPLHRQGMSQRQIHRETGIPRTTVQRSISRFPDPG